MASLPTILPKYGLNKAQIRSGNMVPYTSSSAFTPKGPYDDSISDPDAAKAIGECFVRPPSLDLEGHTLGFRIAQGTWVLFTYFRPHSRHYYRLLAAK